jgi:tRNA(Ile)-lysidine synthase
METRLPDLLENLGCYGKTIIVGVSGGLDSVVLLQALSKTPCQLTVAHANFQLRGEESDQDEAFVKQLAENYRVPYYTRRFDTNNYATQQGLSIQMAARRLRYAWFEELRKMGPYDFVAVAHHLNDSLETALLNFTRGTGLDGLLGIPEKAERILRPLLGFTRSEIEAYAAKHGLTWREDSSNAGDDYKRNFLRHRVVPLLKELNPSLEETFARNAERLRGARELMDAELKRLQENFMRQQKDHVKIAKSLFTLFQFPASVLWELIKDFGFNFDQCREIVRASEGQPGKYFLSSTHQLVVDRESLILRELPEGRREVRIEEGMGEAVLGRWILKIKNTSEPKIDANQMVAALDKDKLQFPLAWRTWKSGDSFVPLGMDHQRKLSDFLVDKKVALTDKQQVTVLESGGEIAWVVGYRIDDRFKITDQTKTAVIFHLTENH